MTKYNDRNIMNKCIKSAMRLPKQIHGMMYPLGDNPLVGINIEQEYKLIQEKKSKQPAKIRKLIVIVVENKIKIKENK